jgi:hypothetical protein
VWNIRKDQESVVVLLDWNHARERVVAGHVDSKTLRVLERASCLVTDVRGCGQVIPTRKVREQCFVGMF